MAAEIQIDNDDRLRQQLFNWHHINSDSADYSYTEQLDWCLKHCQGQFRDFPTSRTGRMWFFENDKDATMFAMRWA